MRNWSIERGVIMESGVERISLLKCCESDGELLVSCLHTNPFKAKNLAFYELTYPTIVG